MSESTLRALKIPPGLSGDAEAVCEQILHPLSRVAVDVVFVLPQLDLEVLAQLTCGMAPLIRGDTGVTVVFLYPDLPSVVDEALRATQAEALSSVVIQQRLSFFKYFAGSGAMRLVVRSITKDDRIGSLLRDNAGVTLLTDRDGTALTIGWQEPVQYAGRNSIAASLRWSFGDPLYQVAGFSQAIKALVDDPASKQSAEAEHIFFSFITSLPEPELPWHEVFNTTSSPGVILFKHQESAVAAWLANGKRGIFKMCTGAGKTIASLACVSSEGNGGNPPVFVTVPTRVLADQWIQQINRMGFTHVLRAYESAANWIGMIEPWMKVKSPDSSRFVVCTYKTFSDQRLLAKLDRLAHAGIRAILIADEMHNLASGALLRAMTAVEGVFQDRIGLSATPEIEGNLAATERLTRFFNGVCASYELADGIRDGVLCHYRYHPFPAYLDPKRGEEYLATLKGIDGAENQPQRLIEFYRQSREIIRKSGVQLPAFESMLDAMIVDRKAMSHTLVYCPPGFSEKTAEVSDDIQVDEVQARLLEDVIAVCRRRGLIVASILGETPSSQRADILERFASGEVQVLCAIGCLDEGVDVPSIQRAIVLYSVDRERQFVQRRGRILRQPKGIKKTADIYDVIILPHGTTMEAREAERLLRKELRRYQVFSDLSLNAETGRRTIQDALQAATRG